jgi:hypothetical protein
VRTPLSQVVNVVLLRFVLCCLLLYLTVLGAPTAFMFEVPKFGPDSADNHTPAAPVRLVPLVLPPKGNAMQIMFAVNHLISPVAAWESLSQQLTLRELARCAIACKVWKATIAHAVSVVTVCSADGARVKVGLIVRIIFCECDIQP